MFNPKQKLITTKILTDKRLDPTQGPEPGRLILWFLLTIITVVVHQNDLFEQMSRRVIDGCVDGAQDHRQGLVDEDEDEGDLGKLSWVADLFASAQRHTNTAHHL